MTPSESNETTAKPPHVKKKPYKADYKGASPEQVAEALLRYRPPEEGPKPEESDRWF